MSSFDQVDLNDLGRTPTNVFVSFQPKSRQAENSTPFSQVGGRTKRNRDQYTLPKTPHTVVVEDEENVASPSAGMTSSVRQEVRTDRQIVPRAPTMHSMGDAFRAIAKTKTVLAERTNHPPAPTMDIQDIMEAAPLHEEPWAINPKFKSLLSETVSFPLLPIDNSIKLSIRYSSPHSFAWVNRVCDETVTQAPPPPLSEPTMTQCRSCAAITPFLPLSSPPQPPTTHTTHILASPLIGSLPVPLTTALSAFHRATDTYLFPPPSHPLFPPLSASGSATQLSAGSQRLAMARAVPMPSQTPQQVVVQAGAAEGRVEWRTALQSLWRQTRAALCAGGVHQWYVVAADEPGPGKDPCVIRIQARPPHPTPAQVNVQDSAQKKGRGRKARQTTGDEKRTHPLLREAPATSAARGAVDMSGEYLLDAICAWLAHPSLALTQALITRGVTPPPPAPVQDVDDPYATSERLPTSARANDKSDATENGLVDESDGLPEWFAAAPAQAPALWLLEGADVAVLIDVLSTHTATLPYLPLLAATKPFARAQRAAPAVQVGRITETTLASEAARGGSAGTTSLALSTLTVSGVVLPECAAALWHVLAWLQQGQLRAEMTVARKSCALNGRAYVRDRGFGISFGQTSGDAQTFCLTPDLCTATAKILSSLVDCRNNNTTDKSLTCLYCSHRIDGDDVMFLRDYGVGSFISRNAALVAGYSAQEHPEIKFDPHHVVLPTRDDMQDKEVYFQSVFTHGFASLMGQEVSLQFQKDSKIEDELYGAQCVLVKMRTPQ